MQIVKCVIFVLISWRGGYKHNIEEEKRYIERKEGSEDWEKSVWGESRRPGTGRALIIKQNLSLSFSFPLSRTSSLSSLSLSLSFSRFDTHNYTVWWEPSCGLVCVCVLCFTVRVYIYIYVCILFFTHPHDSPTPVALFVCVSANSTRNGTAARMTQTLGSNVGMCARSHNTRHSHHRNKIYNLVLCVCVSAHVPFCIYARARECVCGNYVYYGIHIFLGF